MRRRYKPHKPLSDRYMFEDAAGRPPDGEYLHTVSVLCLTGTELTRCHRRRSFNTAVNTEDPMPEERTAKHFKPSRLWKHQPYGGFPECLC